jgi:hypothetical protein
VLGGMEAGCFVQEFGVRPAAAVTMSVIRITARMCLLNVGAVLLHLLCLDCTS